MCVCVCVCVCVYIHTYIHMEVKNGEESDRIEKTEKQCSSKVMNLFGGKSRLKRFGFSETSSGL